MATEPQKRTWNDYYTKFASTFPTVESRHAIAVSLAQNPRHSSGEVPETQYLSQYFIASHWRDDKTTSREVANFVYSLKQNIDDHIGQPAIVFSKGSLNSLLPKTDSCDRIELVRGIVEADELDYGFRGITDKKRGPTHDGVYPPYIHFAARLTMSDTSFVSADRLDGSYEATGFDPDPRPINAYVGTITLSTDQLAYDRQRKVHPSVILMGQEACSIVEEALADRFNAAPLSDLRQHAVAV